MGMFFTQCRRKVAPRKPTYIYEEGLAILEIISEEKKNVSFCERVTHTPMKTMLLTGASVILNRAMPSTVLASVGRARVILSDLGERGGG
jgi:hypothetical protein